MNFDDWLTRLKEYEQKATPKEKWEGYSNTPFYAVLEKPAPSLSKHDYERPHYWRCEDVNYVLFTRHQMAKLLEVVEKQNKALQFASTDNYEGPGGFFYPTVNASIAKDVLREIEEIVGKKDD